MMLTSANGVLSLHTKYCCVDLYYFLVYSEAEF
jgi:hypothetical protein